MRITGNCAMYNGKEYSLGFDPRTEEYELASYDSQDLSNGFIRDDMGIYRKKIKLEELETAYSIYTWCKFKGYNFQVILYSEEDDIYEIVHVNNTKPIPVTELGFTFSERGVYKKKVKGKELDSVYEVKSPILGFK